MDRVIFKRKLLNLLYDSYSWDFKIDFFPLQYDITITLLCPTVGGMGAVGSITGRSIVLQKTNINNNNNNNNNNNKWDGKLLLISGGGDNEGGLGVV